MAIYSTIARKARDTQVFEYSDTLSLPVDKTVYTKAHVGDVVKVGDILGILQSEIAPSEAELQAMSISEGFIPQALPTYGLNHAGYASVRVKGGVWNLDVEHSGAKPVGTLVYAVPATADSGKVTLTTDGTAIDAVVFGFLYNAAPAAGTTANLPVVFDTSAKPVAAA